MEIGSENERAPLGGHVSFFREGGIARAFLDVVGFYLAVIPLLLVIAVALLTASGNTRGLVSDLYLTGLPVLIAVGLVTAFMVFKRRWTLAMAGWPSFKPGRAWFGKGLLLGIGMAFGAVALGVGFGGARVEWVGSPVPYVATAVPVIGGLLLAALAEELLFRGYPLRKLAGAVGPVRASVLLAIGFSAVHYGNPEVSGLGLFNIGLASLVLSAIFFTPGGLAAAWGLHLGWNTGLALVDAPVSGISFDLPAVDYGPGGLAVLTGGGFGPEGGVAASLVMVAALVWIVVKWISKEKV